MSAIKPLLLGAWLAWASVAVSARADDAVATPPVQITALRNAGTLDYGAYYALQRKLLGYMPPDHAHVQPFLRLSFTDLTADQQDGYEPADWAVAVVSDSSDHPVASLRGGYFVLPNLPLPEGETASILFNARTKAHFLAVAWSIPPDVWPRLDVAAVRAALRELHATQANIPWYALGLRTEKYDSPDLLKVCFDGAGTVGLGDRRYASRDSGCALVPLRDLDAAATPALALVLDGRLSFVSLGHSTGYGLAP
ncbi:hypothetical protein ASF61_14170 [Duganella sp. Leaf126]|uniref:hypothetical protein n=1 Tax=Duganella sp. Leaf126 TaxID=1736266 RepID=UPI000701C23A|nr:hypothetical protein [Duganella sp. Leaf126]KQQ32682.1 hypothetical protein ASF61_14170 [Duganella sp. Leaf126]